MDEQESKVFEIWPRYEDGTCVMPGDTVAFKDGTVEKLCQVFIGSFEYGLYGETEEEYYPFGTAVKRGCTDVL